MNRSHSNDAHRDTGAVEYVQPNLRLPRATMFVFVAIAVCGLYGRSGANQDLVTGDRGGTSATTPTPTDNRPMSTSPTPTSGAETAPRARPTTSSPQPVSANCDAINGTIDLPGGRALVRSPATDHLRAAVVMLHGYRHHRRRRDSLGWTRFLAGTDVALVYPEGNPTSAGGYGWTTGTDRFSTSRTDDVGVIAQMVGWLVSENCVDENQVLIAGESNGSALGLLVACSGRLPDTARLYALAIPAVDENVTAKCADAEPEPLLVFASRLDGTVPSEGTPSDPDSPTAPKTWFTSLVPGLQRCSSAAPSTRSVPDGTVLTYPGCKHVTAFFTVDDGHTRGLAALSGPAASTQASSPLPRSPGARADSPRRRARWAIAAPFSPPTSFRRHRPHADRLTSSNVPAARSMPRIARRTPIGSPKICRSLDGRTTSPWPCQPVPTVDARWLPPHDSVPAAAKMSPRWPHRRPHRCPPVTAPRKRRPRAMPRWAVPRSQE